MHGAQQKEVQWRKAAHLAVLSLGVKNALKGTSRSLTNKLAAIQIYGQKRPHKAKKQNFRISRTSKVDRGVMWDGWLMFSAYVRCFAITVQRQPLPTEQQATW